MQLPGGRWPGPCAACVRHLPPSLDSDQGPAAEREPYIVRLLLRCVESPTLPFQPRHRFGWQHVSTDKTSLTSRLLPTLKFSCFLVEASAWSAGHQLWTLTLPSPLGDMKERPRRLSVALTGPGPWMRWDSLSKALWSSFGNQHSC